MTGYGASEKELDGLIVRVEIKSVNQRFFEIHFHMDNHFAFLEEHLKKIIHQKIRRGKLDVYVSDSFSQNCLQEVTVNEGLAKGYQNAYLKLSEILNIPLKQNLEAIASFPNVLTVADPVLPVKTADLLESTIKEALESIDSMRIQEGAFIKEDFLSRLSFLEVERRKMEEILPTISERYRTHLNKTIREFTQSVDFDETRVLEEVAIYSDKVDFTEELVRLKSHMTQFKKSIIEDEEPIGRKLDFLIQEMNRETNTIGSKANDAQVATIVVQIKSELEKIREQVQNIE